MKFNIEKHKITNWEVSIMEINTDEGTIFKVTRRLPEMLVAETRVFKSKEEAKKLFDEWLN